MVHLQGLLQEKRSVNSRGINSGRAYRVEVTAGPGPENPSVPKRIDRQIAETSPHWCNHTDRKTRGAERSFPALVGAPAAVADIVNSGAFPRQWLLVAHRIAPRTGGTDVRPCMMVLGSCCRRGLYSAGKPEGFAAYLDIRDGAKLRLGDLERDRGDCRDFALAMVS